MRKIDHESEPMQNDGGPIQNLQLILIMIICF